VLAAAAVGAALRQVLLVELAALAVLVVAVRAAIRHLLTC
jgi:hypothetical protein